MNCKFEILASIAQLSESCDENEQNNALLQVQGRWTDSKRISQSVQLGNMIRRL